MECRDAIELIKELLTDMNEHYSMYDGGGFPVIQALEGFAIPAMEKEVASDVVVETGSSRRVYYTCPNCTNFIKWKYNLDRSTYEPDRCPFCGQSLNWRS